MIFNTSTQEMNSFETIKNRFDVVLFNNYIHHLRKIITDLNIKHNDQRVVFSIRENQLNFTVGQRYAFNLFLNNPNGTYGVISKEKLLESSGSYEGNHPQPFYTYYNEFSPTIDEWILIISAIKVELERTNLSSYRRYQNSDFENYIFEITNSIKDLTEIFIPIIS
jgi:hypothetical protein